MDSRISMRERAIDDRPHRSIFFPAIVAGLAGGAAEVLWIFALGVAGKIDAASVTSAVALTLVPSTTPSSLLPALALGIHFGLSALLGVVFGAQARRFLLRGETLHMYLAGTLLLLLIWAMNFFVVLPIIGSPLPAVIPLPLSFVSKALFALAMVATLSVLWERRVAPSLPRYTAHAQG